MNRIAFDSLDINKQVDYINQRLLLGDTLTNICKDVGIGRSTVRERFKNKGYEYNSESKQYKDTANAFAFGSGVESGIGVVSGYKQSSNLVVDENNIEKILLNYNEINNKLNVVYEWYQNSSKEVVEENKLVIGDFEGELVSRSFKLYKSIQEEFSEFCKINNKYKVQDILCQFIKEGLEKYGYTREID